MSSLSGRLAQDFRVTSVKNSLQEKRIEPAPENDVPLPSLSSMVRSGCAGALAVLK